MFAIRGFFVAPFGTNGSHVKVLMTPFKQNFFPDKLQSTADARNAQLAQKVLIRLKCMQLSRVFADTQ